MSGWHVVDGCFSISFGEYYFISVCASKDILYSAMSLIWAFTMQNVWFGFIDDIKYSNR